MDFATFDTRGYRTVVPREGYREWAATYEESVEDAMDIDLLDRLEAVRWAEAERAADLGCGTGRTGAWLSDRGIAEIDGVDLTPEMLDIARARGVYRELVEGDVGSTRLPTADYGLVTACLVDEHLPDLFPLYSEAWRLARSGATFVLVGFHPHFIMAAGMPTHFDDDAGEAIAIETHVHLLSDQITAGLAVGWTLVEIRERTIDDAWLAVKPKWERFRGHPVTFALVWRKGC
jgi:SAM-dependent methyltransferase